MKLSHFKFDLPSELLAEYPSEVRDEARLMVLNRKDHTIEHKLFKDLVHYFDEGDIMVFNNTKVFPERLYGNKLFFGDNDDLVAEVIDNTTSRGRTLRFLFDGSYEEFRKKLQDLGETPLPKYIKREAEPEDAERYQTIYAKHEGAVAAPTAGLHFSRHLIKRLEIKGIDLAEVTLHVGLGTFQPVEVEDLSKHKMDSEEIHILESAADAVNKALDKKTRVCAVGTTVMRTMESSVSADRRLKPFKGWTHKFIFPPYEFSIADAMVTNFHTPQSTLMMMTAAFAGHDFLKEAYQEAIKEKYNFYSYGDAMLIL